MSKLPGAAHARIGACLYAMVTRDVFPDFSTRARRVLYNPLGVLVLGALASLLCGLLLHSQGFALCGGVVAVIAVGIAWPWLTLRGLHGSICFDRSRASEGETTEACLTLGSRLPWSAPGLSVRGGFTAPAGDGQTEAPVSTIAAAPRRRTAHCRWTFVPLRRGVYPLEPPRLATGFPFGLWENKRRVAILAPLIVWPRTLPVGPVPVIGGDQWVEGNVTRDKVGSSGDVVGVRPYRRGDSPRRIHWAQSARHDRLIVCEVQSNTRPVIQLILDSDPRGHAGDGSTSSREWAIRIVASFASGWLEAGAQVGAVWNGQVFAPASGPQQLHRLMDALAALPDITGPTLSETLELPACRGFDAGLQVVVTTDVAVGRACGSVAGSEARRWVVLRTAAFLTPAGGAPMPPAGLPVKPWLWIDSLERVPVLLRAGWREARHGS